MAKAADLDALAMQLYNRLRELVAEEGDTDEELAYKLGTSARDVGRLKSGFGPNQQKLLGMLDVVGWLTPGTPLTEAEATERAAVYATTRRLQRRLRGNNREASGSPEG